MHLLDRLRRKKKEDADIMVIEKDGYRITRFPGVPEHYIEVPEPKPGNKGFLVRPYSVKELTAKDISGKANLGPLMQTFGLEGEYRNVSASETVYLAEEIGQSSSITSSDYEEYQEKIAAALSSATGSNVPPRTIRIVRTQQINVSSDATFISQEEADSNKRKKGDVQSSSD